MREITLQVVLKTNDTTTPARYFERSIQESLGHQVSVCVMQDMLDDIDLDSRVQTC